MGKRKPKTDDTELILTLMAKAFQDGFMAARDLIVLKKAVSDENKVKMCEFYIKQFRDELEKGVKL